MSDKIPDKPIADYTEEEIKEMFLELFFWVSENREEWLQEAIERKKAMLIAEQLEAETIHE